MLVHYFSTTHPSLKNVYRIKLSFILQYNDNNKSMEAPTHTRASGSPCSPLSWCDRSSGCLGSPCGWWHSCTLRRSCSWSAPPPVPCPLSLIQWTAACCGFAPQSSSRLEDEAEKGNNLKSSCGSVDKTTDSQSWGLQFESAGSGSNALGQCTLSSLPSTSEGPWLLAYIKQLAFLVAR